jgi:hypothetical protein
MMQKDGSMTSYTGPIGEEYRKRKRPGAASAIPSSAT